MFYDEQLRTRGKVVIATTQDFLKHNKAYIMDEYYRLNRTNVNQEDLNKLDVLMVKLYNNCADLYNTCNKIKGLESSIRKFGIEPEEHVRQYMDDFIEDYTNEHPNHNAIVDKLSKDIEREYEFDVTIGVHTPVDLNYSSDFNFKDIIKSNPERSKQIVDFYPKLLDELKSKLNIYGFTPYIIPH